MDDVHPVLAGLDEEQRLAVQAPRGPVAIVAGAGTGKTTAITRRIAWQAVTGQVSPDVVLAVTHSTKAAGELRDRLAKLGVAGASARTFHSAALRILRHFWAATGRTGELAVLDSPYPLVRRALRRVAGGSRSSGEEVFDIAAEIGWGRARLLDPASYPGAAETAGRQVGVDFRTIAAVWEAYLGEVERSGKLDFEGLLTACTDLLEQRGEVAAQVRARYQSFVVDEYQDTDLLQSRFLDALLGCRDELCVVGDPRQAIYAFKGGDHRLLEDFSQRFPGATVVRLVRDYRSTPEIVRLANRLIPVSRAEALVGQRPAGPVPLLRVDGDEAAEEAGIVAAIRRSLGAGTPASEIAVLVRFNAQSARLEAALAAARIPYSVSDTGRFFDRPEVRDPLRAFGRAARAGPEEPGVVMVRDALGAAGFDRDRPPASAGAMRQRWEAQLALLEMLEAIPGIETLSASALLAEVNRRAVEQHAPSISGVTLATLHKAKGLEWDVVFLPGLTEGALPSMYATTPDAVEEERRLLYVGMTRARQELHLSWSSSRSGPNGATWTSRPSRFLADLGLGGRPMGRKRSVGQSARSGERLAQGGATPPISGSDCARCGERLRGLGPRLLGRCPSCLEGADRALLEQLHAWREQLATGGGLQPGDVATEHALVLLVATKPTRPAELGAVAGLRVDGVHAAELLALLA